MTHGWPKEINAGWCVVMSHAPWCPVTLALPASGLIVPANTVFANCRCAVAPPTKEIPE